MNDVPHPVQPAVLSSMRRHFLVGMAACAALIVGGGGWATMTELAGAVIANGTVVVETNLKKVQHPTGGIVGALSVKDGAMVRAGDVVIRLDETLTRANLAVVVKTLDELDGRRARLEAERDAGAAVVFPQELTVRAAREPDVEKIIVGERRLFDARRTALAGQKAQLAQRIDQYAREIEGLEAQQRSNLEQIGLIRSELKGVAALFAKNLVPITRLTTLQREASRLDGERGQIIASIAQTRGKIAETELQVIQLDQQARTEALKELREIEGKQGELIERKVAAEDQLKRVDIRSPQDGVVHQLAVHTVGGVIGPGEVLMLIVPEADTLTIEAHVAPQDIDQVVVGQPATVRLSAFNQRTTPELFGEVIRIAADLTQDQRTGATYYTARIRLSESETARLKGLKLLPGMPAEVYIRTVDRTALSYLVKPLTDQFARAFKEE